MRKKILIFISLVLALLLPVSSVSAAIFISSEGTVVNDGKKLVICHRNNDVKHPYVENKLPFSAFNGGGNNDHTLHKGPLVYTLAEAILLKGDDDKIKWGDIIPSFTYGDFEYEGMNWTTNGKNIYFNDCEYLPIEISAIAPTFVDGTCRERSGKYLIPELEGVEYFIKDGRNWKKISDGWHEIKKDGVKVEIKAEIAKKYKDDYKLVGITEWNFTFNIPSDDECDNEDEDEVVTPIAPTFVDPTCDKLGTYEIPTKEGVVYMIDDEVVSADVYDATVDGSITIIAKATKGYVLEDELKASWTHTFTTPTDCDEDNEDEDEIVTPAAVIFTQSTCDALGYYTVPTTTGVKYYVNDAVVAAGKYTAANGTTVTVTAVVDEGYELKEGAVNQWTNTFTAPTNCVDDGDTLGTSTTLPNTSGSSTAAVLVVVSTVLGLITILGSSLKNLFIQRF